MRPERRARSGGLSGTRPARPGRGDDPRPIVGVLSGDTARLPRSMRRPPGRTSGAGAERTRPMVRLPRPRSPRGPVAAGAGDADAGDAGAGDAGAEGRRRPAATAGAGRVRDAGRTERGAAALESNISHARGAFRPRSAPHLRGRAHRPDHNAGGAGTSRPTPWRDARRSAPPVHGLSTARPPPWCAAGPPARPVAFRTWVSASGAGAESSDRPRNAGGATPRRIAAGGHGKWTASGPGA